MNNRNVKDKPALPRKWLVPIRLAVYIVLAGCSAYIYYFTRDLEWTHLLIFLPVAAVAAMVLLDCKFSENYWKELDAKQNSDKEN